ncbi:MAG: hypothetical protein PVJ13_13920, partial [Desulfobacterales bacterium]
VGWWKGDFIGEKKYRHNDAWGSLKNKVAILGAAAAGKARKRINGWICRVFTPAAGRDAPAAKI